MINRHLKRIELVRAIVLFAIVADATASVASWGVSAATRGEIAERDARELERRSEVQWGGWGDDDGYQYTGYHQMGQEDPDNHVDLHTCKGTVDTSCGGYACVALYADGSASAWGNPSEGGDITETDNGRVVDLSGTTTKVAAISCGGHACVALYADGSATVWGNAEGGGDITKTDNGDDDGGGDLTETDNGRVVDLSGTTTKVTAISCGNLACVALYADGSASVWGGRDYGGDITKTDNGRVVDLSGTTTKVAAISCGGFACVALYADGSATVWGWSMRGGDITKTDNGRVVDLSGTTTKVAAISCGKMACVALYADGSATAWGSPYDGGDLTKTDNGRVVDLSGTTTKVAAISCGGRACVALYADGSATAWGDPNRGGDITKTDNGRVVDLSGTTTKVAAISCGSYACVALYADGSATAWGDSNKGGDITKTDNGRVVDLSGTTTKVAAISCGGSAYTGGPGSACVALYADGSATVWGSSYAGGDLTASTLYPYLQAGGRFEPGVDYLASGVADISCGERACVARYCNLFSWCSNVADEPSVCTAQPVEASGVCISCTCPASASDLSTSPGCIQTEFDNFFNGCEAASSPNCYCDSTATDSSTGLAYGFIDSGDSGCKSPACCSQTAVDAGGAALADSTAAPTAAPSAAPTAAPTSPPSPRVIDDASADDTLALPPTPAPDAPGEDAGDLGELGEPAGDLGELGEPAADLSPSTGGGLSTPALAGIIAGGAVLLGAGIWLVARRDGGGGGNDSSIAETGGGGGAVVFYSTER